MPRLSVVLLALLSLAFSACSGGDPEASAKPSGALGACLERPEQLPRPPSNLLPCELIPPDLLVQ